LCKLHDGNGNVWSRIHGKVQKFSNKFAIFRGEVPNEWVKVSVASKRMVWVHWKVNWIAVEHAMFVEKVSDVIGLMHPQFM
jgi:hypothetical protein